MTIPIPEGGLTVGGLTPILTLAISLSVGSLSLAGAAPTLGHATTVPSGSVLYAGHAPTVSIGVVVSVPAGAIAYTGVAPSLAFRFHVPSGSISLIGQVPSTGYGLPIPVGSLSLQGLAPSLGGAVVVSVPAGGVSLVGTSSTLAIRLSVPLGTLTLTGASSALAFGLPLPAGALTLTGAAPAISSTYYVDATGGSDANDGLSPGGAWQTLAKVNGETFTPGDFILLKRGEVWRYPLIVSWSGTAVNPITFGAYGTGAKPILTYATVYVSTWTSIGSNRWTTPDVWEPTQIFFDNVRGTRETTQAGVNAPGDWHWAADVTTVYSTSNPTTAFTSPGVESDGGGDTGVVNAYDRDYLTFIDLHATKSAYGFWLAGPGSFNTVIDCEASWCYYDGITCTGTNPTVTNSDSHDNYTAGLTFREVANNAAVSGGHYYNNAPGVDVLSPRGNGVSFQGVTDGVVTGATSDNNTYGFKAFGSGTDRITFRQCTAYDNTLFGIDLDNVGTGCVVEYCVAHDNATHQIAVELDATDSIVRYNRVYGGPAGEGLAGIEVLITTNTRVYGNVISDCENGIAIYSSPANLLIYNNTIVNATTAGITAGFDNDTISGLVLKNNLVSGSGTYVITTGTYPLTGFVSDFNLWHSGGGNRMFYDGTAYSLAGWRTATGQDANAIDSDPLFVDAGGGNYALTTASPAHDAGVNLGASYEDLLSASSTWPASVVLIDQDDFGLAWEIGAYVFDAANPVISVPVGSLVLTGRSIGVAFLGPAQGALLFTGYAPSLVVGFALPVPVGALTLTGYSASLARSVDIPVGVLTLTGLAPSLGGAVAIQVPVGDVTLSGLTPALGGGLSIPSGAVTLTGQALVLARGLPIPAGAVTFTGTTPTLGITGADTIIQVPVGAITFTGQSAGVAFLGPGVGVVQFVGYAPSLVVGFTLPVPVGALELAGHSTSLALGVDIPVGSVTLTGLAPSLGGAVAIAMPAGVVTLTGLQPAVTLQLSLPAGLLALTGYTPVMAQGLTFPAGAVSLTGYPVSLGVARPVPVGTLSLSGHAPIVTTGVAIAIPVGTLTLQGSAPSLGFVFAIPAGTLVLTGQIPTITGAGAISVPAGTVVLQGSAPSLALATALPSGSLTLTGQAVTLAAGRPIPAGVVTFAGTVPVLAFGVAIQVGTLQLTGTTPNPAIAGSNPVISVPVGAITVTGQSIGVAFLGPAQGVLQVTGYAPTLRLSVRLTLPTGALTLTGQAPTVTVSAGPLIPVPAGALSYTGQAPTLRYWHVLEVPVGALTLTGQYVGVAFLTPAAGQITFVGYAPTVAITGGAIAIGVPTGSLALAGYPFALSFTIPVPVGSVALTGQAPVTIGGRSIVVPAGTLAVVGHPAALSFGIAVPTGSIALTGQATSVNGAASIQIPAGSISLAGHSPTSIQSWIIAVPSGSVSLTGAALIVVSPVTVSIPAGTVTFTGTVLIVNPFVAQPREFFVVAAQDRWFVVGVQDRWFIVDGDS